MPESCSASAMAPPSPCLAQEALTYVTIIEEAMVKGFPFEIPKEYADLPQLKVRGQSRRHHLRCHRTSCPSILQTLVPSTQGRATIDMKVNFASPREDNSTGGVLRIVADGCATCLCHCWFSSACCWGSPWSSSVELRCRAILQL